MPEQTFNCPACGGPNQPEAGSTRMTCAYCSANLTIPENLRAKAKPKAKRIPVRPQPIQVPEFDTSDVLRKAQPIAIRAWNLYAYWTWLRWLLPACLTIFVVGILLCVALGLIPVMWISNR
jgi:hypothetical protein